MQDYDNNRPAPREETLWVFGYGSLMWNPGFAFAQRLGARLNGYRRAFCIYSTHHRGTHEKPGLVLGLDRGGACEGAAFRIRPEDRSEVLRYLREREQVSGVYREARVSLDLPLSDGIGSGFETVTGIAYIVEPRHPGYTGPLTISEQARLIRAATGLSGPNVEYLVQTCRQLRDAGIRDREIERVLASVGGLFASRDGPQVKAASRVLINATRQQRPFAPLLHRAQRRRFVHRVKLDALKE